jgi:hypothetical protein
VDVHLDLPRQVFGVAAHDPRAEFVEAFVQHVGVAVEGDGRVDQVARVEVHGEAGAVDRLDQREGALGGVGHGPPHHLIAELRARRLDRVEDRPRVLHGRIEKFLGEVVRVRAVPDVGVERARDVHAAAGPHRVGQRQSLGHRGEVLLALLRVGVGQVAPAADLGDHDVGLRERLFDGLDAAAVLEVELGAVRRAVALRPVPARQLDRIIGLGEARRAEPERIFRVRSARVQGGCGARGQRGLEKGPAAHESGFHGEQRGKQKRTSQAWAISETQRSRCRHARSPGETN